jgi:hypothetical protein
MLLSSSSNASMGLVRRVKAAAAICVAGEIFAQAMKRPASPGKLLRTKMAGDALDKTQAGIAIASKYSTKPEEQSDVEFLLQNLADIRVLALDEWPNRKVSPVDWAEYTRAMRGLELFIKKGFVSTTFTKTERADISGMLDFLAPQLRHVADADVIEALQAPGDFQ